MGKTLGSLIATIALVLSAQTLTACGPVQPSAAPAKAPPPATDAAGAAPIVTMPVAAAGLALSAAADTPAAFALTVILPDEAFTPGAGVLVFYGAQHQEIATLTPAELSARTADTGCPDSIAPGASGVFCDGSAEALRHATEIVFKSVAGHDRRASSFLLTTTVGGRFAAAELRLY